MSATDNVVANVRGLMGETKVSQAEVGRWLGLSQAAVAKRISTRSVVFNVDELEAIADHFGVSVQSLFDPPRVLVPFRGVANPSVRTITDEYHDLKTYFGNGLADIEAYLSAVAA